MPWLRILSPELPKLIWFLVLNLFLACLSGTARAEVAVTDALGREIRLAAPATRIIALYGAFNEILADLGREGATMGAQIMAWGTPKEVAGMPQSHTGRFLKPLPERERS